MNAQLRTEPLGAIILALIFATIGMAACTDEPRDGPVTSMIGTIPAEPTSQIETPTPVEPAKASPQAAAGKDSEIVKKQESTDMPLPGQANDHSTLAPDASQKAAPAPAANR